MPEERRFDFDTNLYSLAEKGSGYAKRSLITIFIEHIDHSFKPPPELLQFVADFLRSEISNIKNDKGFHENDWEAWNNAIEVFNCKKTGKAKTYEDAFFIVAADLSEGRDQPISTETIKRHWALFGPSVSNDESPPIEVLAGVRKKGKKM